MVVPNNFGLSEKKRGENGPVNRCGMCVDEIRFDSFYLSTNINEGNYI
jgi:hypothetical protein